MVCKTYSTLVIFMTTALNIRRHETVIVLDLFVIWGIKVLTLHLTKLLKSVFTSQHDPTLF